MLHQAVICSSLGYAITAFKIFGFFGQSLAVVVVIVFCWCVSAMYSCVGRTVMGCICVVELCFCAVA